MKKVILIVTIMIIAGVGYFYYKNQPSTETREIVNTFVPEGTTRVEKEIIGTQAQTVINELDKKRLEGNIQNIKSNLNSIRSEALFYFDQNNLSYTGMCTAHETGYFPQLDVKYYPEGTSLNCNVSSDGKTYAVQAIYSGAGWCVDSERFVMETEGSIGTKTSCI